MFKRRTKDEKASSAKDNSQATQTENALVISGNRSLEPQIKVKRNETGEFVTAESFGIEAVVEGRVGMMSVIIPAGRRVPCHATKRYFPVEDHQKEVKVSCFKGEKSVARDNTKLGEFVVSGLTSRRITKSQGVEITFTINRSGILLIDALEVENPSNHLKVRMSYVEKPAPLLAAVAKGVLKELSGMILPAPKK